MSSKHISRHLAVRHVFNAVVQIATANLAAFFVLFRHPRTRWKRERYDCALVCGYFANDDGTASEMMKTRVERAARLKKEDRVQYLIMSGAAVHNNYIEAEVMQKYALKLGVPKDSILMEKRAVSTYHNMLYSKEAMHRCGFRNCVVVTNGWHMRKADHYARKQKLNYVMCRARNPEGQSFWEWLCLCMRTSIVMYLNAWKGLY